MYTKAIISDEQAQRAINICSSYLTQTHPHLRPVGALYEDIMPSVPAAVLVVTSANHLAAVCAGTIAQIDPSIINKKDRALIHKL